MRKPRQFIRLAQDWGVSKKLISQILIAGVHNSIGRAAAIAGQQPRAFKHFESAIQTGTPGNDVRLLTQARAGEQLGQIDLSVVNGPLQLQKSEAQMKIAVPSETMQKVTDDVAKKLKEEIKAEVQC
jgi:hypothetical protein